MSNDDRAAWKLALYWAIATVLVRLVWLYFQPPIPEWDGAIYHRTAERIARGMGFVDTWNNLPPYKPTAFYPVGYPALLGAFYFVFGSHYWVAGFINVLSSAIATASITRMTQRAWGALSAHVAAALFTFSPGGILYCSAYMTELVSAALLCLAMMSAIRYSDTGRWRWAIVTGLLLGYGGLVRPPALLIAPVVAVLAAPRSQPRLVATIRALVLVGIASCAVVLPWTARNCRQLDGCALVSLNGGSNLWIGADPAAMGTYRDLRIGEACLRVRGEVAKDRCFGRLAMDRIKEHPLQWLALAPLKIGHLLGYESTPVSYLRAATRQRAFAQSSTAMYSLLTAYHWVILALAIASVASMKRHQLTAAVEPSQRSAAALTVVLSVAVVLALIAVHVVFFGVDRYHFVFIPLLCMLAGGAFRKTASGPAATQSEDTKASP
jgi:4-amino-4-deoxy-L-arabinose transferase-like glycosyltransferase